MGTLPAGYAARVVLLAAVILSVGTSPTWAAKASAWTNAAAEVFNKGKYDKAIRYAEKAVKKDPSYAYAYYWLGVAHLRKGDYAEAVTAFENRIRLSQKPGSQYNDSVVGLALAYHSVSRYEEAIERFRQAKELMPDSIVASEGLQAAEDGRFARDMSRTLFESSNLRAAADVLRRGYRRASRPGWGQWAAAYTLRLCDPRAAQDLLLADNEPAAVTGLLLQSYLQLGDEKQVARIRGGVSYFGVSLEQRGSDVVGVGGVEPDNPAARAGMRSGDLLLSVDGRPIKGMESARTVMATLDPGLPVPVVVRRGSKEVDLTVTPMNFMDLSPPTDPRACEAQKLNAKGLELIRAGKPTEALAKFEEAIRVAPGLLAKAHFNVGLLAEQTGDVARAVEQYTAAQRAFLLPSDRVEVLTRLFALAARAAIPVPDTADRRYRIGILRTTQERYAEAITEFEAAIEEAPWLVDAYNNLGVVYDHQKDYAAALEALTIYTRLKPDAANIDEAKFKMVELEDRLGLLGQDR